MLIHEPFFSTRAKGLKLVSLFRIVGLERFTSSRRWSKRAELRCVLCDNTRLLGFRFSLWCSRPVTSCVVSRLGLWSSEQKLIYQYEERSISWCLHGAAWGTSLLPACSPLVSVGGWVFCEAFLVCAISSSRTWFQVFISSWDSQFSCVCCWMCLAFELSLWLLLGAPWWDCFLNETQVFCAPRGRFRWACLSDSWIPQLQSLARDDFPEQQTKWKSRNQKDKSLIGKGRCPLCSSYFFFLF